jgi:hypothetical protein
MTLSQVDVKQQNGSAGTRTVTLATAPAAGDLILAAVGHGGPKAAATLATPSAGWTLLHSYETTGATHGVAIYGRVATGADPLAYTTNALTGGGTWLLVGAWHSTVGAFTATELAAAIRAQIAVATATATELTATPAAGPFPAASVGIAAHHGGTTTTTLAYWDGDTLGHTPFMRASVAVADVKIETSAPVAPSVRVASWAAASCALAAVWVPEVVACSSVPPGICAAPVC